MKPWVVYILECVSGAYYTGITNDLDARYLAHQEGRGAKFTRGNPPKRVLAKGECADRSTASRIEWLVKKQPRHEKRQYLERLINEAQT